MATNETLNELLKVSLGESRGARLAALLNEIFLEHGTDGILLADTAADKLGFYGATPVVQQADADQEAVTASTDFSGADTVDKAVVLAAVQAVETLVNRLRADLVTLGLIKGEAAE